MNTPIFGEFILHTERVQDNIVESNHDSQWEA